ncbi:MAG: hypothetical protein ACREPE_13545 [Lysobacter sp.]
MKLPTMAVICSAILSGCAVDQALAKNTCLGWAQVEANPKRYAGKTITLHGWFSTEFETCDLKPSGYISSVDVWILPQDEEQLCSLDQATKRPVHSWAAVSGVFHYGEKYGHLGSYNAAISNAKITILPGADDKACVAQ